MMGVLDAGAAVIRGFFDPFDRAAAVVDSLREEVEGNDDIPMEFHRGGKVLVQVEGKGEIAEVKPHFCDRKREYLDELDGARRDIMEACQTCQRILAELP